MQLTNLLIKSNTDFCSKTPANGKILVLWFNYWHSAYEHGIMESAEHIWFGGNGAFPSH